MQLVMLPPNTSFFANSHAGYSQLELLPSRDHASADDTQPHTQEDAYNLCNFNRHLKIQPKIFEYWMQILDAVPNAHLYLLEFPAASKPHLQQFAARLNLSSQPESRLHFLPFVADPYFHWERIARTCDLMVDNPIYNAHTMLVDTLWAGVPVLTWYDGVDMGGRVGRR
jgi:predicted O-linked N-acetylglucosamine transferase (SPINDLY family)